MLSIPFGNYGFEIGVSAVSIMIALSGIVAGIGYALDDRKIKELGRNEFFQSLISGAMLVSFLVLFSANGAISGMVGSVINSSSAGFSCSRMADANAALCFAYNYLVGSTYTLLGHVYPSLMLTTTAIFSSLILLSAALGFLAGIKVSVVLVTVSLSSAISPFLGEIQYALGILTALMVGTAVEASVIVFSSATVVSVILPLGLVLRTFYATRKLGGFFIAVAIGLYVVFPLSYLMDALMVNSYYTAYDSSSLQQVTAQAGQISSSYLSSFTVQRNDSGGVLPHLAGSVSSVLNSMESALNGLFLYLAVLLVQVLVLPVFNLVITAISIRELSALLGAEAFFGRLKII
jgi:hypothetical protein